MRATLSLLAAVVVAGTVVAAGPGTAAGLPTSVLAADPADALEIPPDALDGLLYPDPETGCIRPWREGDGHPVTAEDIWGPRSADQDPSVPVQGLEPLPAPFGETHRGPWPICDELAARVRDTP